MFGKAPRMKVIFEMKAKMFQNFRPLDICGTDLYKRPTVTLGTQKRSSVTSLFKKYTVR